MATSTKSKTSNSSSNVKALSNKLAGVAKVAKSLGINTAKSDAMVAQTKVQGSKAYKGSSYDKGQKDTAVPKATDLGKVTPAALPVAPAPVKTPTLALDGVEGYTTGAQGYTAIPVDSSTDTLDASNARSAQNGLQYLRDMMGLAPQADQGVNDYARMEKEAGIKKLEKAVSQYTGSLNSILATRDQNLEQLRGTGSQYGVTEAVYGGQANEINREAYIKAAPVQAALDTAQGNLQMAEARLDKLFAIHQQDVKNTHDYNVNMVQSLYQFMDKQETNRANQLIAREGQKYQEKTNNINYLRQLSAMAIQTGQQGLITQLGNIDPNSPTFEQDVARLQSQIRIPVASTGGGIKAPEVKSINGVDMQWNPSTGQWETIAGGADGTYKPVKDAEIRDLSETWTAKNSVLSLVKSLQDNIRESGTQNLFGKTAGQRTGDTTNLLLAMKNLEKTGALDKGTIDVLEGTIPSSKFFATEAGQIAALQSIADTITSKVDEYVGSYRGTTAEIDPRTKRIYGGTQTFNPALFDSSDYADIDVIFGTTANSTTSFNPASFY